MIFEYFRNFIFKSYNFYVYVAANNFPKHKWKKAYLFQAIFARIKHFLILFFYTILLHVSRFSNRKRKTKEVNEKNIFPLFCFVVT